MKNTTNNNQKQPLTLIMLSMLMHYTLPQSLTNQLTGYQLLPWVYYSKRMENSVDPDQLASLRPPDLYQHCF